MDRDGTSRAWARRQGARLWLPGALSALLALLVACGLEVSDLPVNRLPVVGSIEMSPPPEELQPADRVLFQIEAYDPDEGDDVYYSWSSGGLGEWISSTADSVYWIAPTSFGGIDSVHISVSVYDFDQSNSIRRHLDFAVETGYGDLLVHIRDLEGNPAAARLVVADSLVNTDGEGWIITEESASEHLFEDLQWGRNFVFNLASASFHGADLEMLPVFFGYPDTLFIEANALLEHSLVLAPKSALLVPGLVPGAEGNELIQDIQTGIDYCRDQGIDSLLLRKRSFDLSAPLGAPAEPHAALYLTEADLSLLAFPGEGIVELNVGSDLDFGIYLEGRGAGTRLAGLAVRGADATGIYLRNSSAAIDTVLCENCGSAGIVHEGGAGDQLALDAVELRGDKYGILMAGGGLTASGLVVQGAAWYGIWLRDGASAQIGTSTLVANELAALFSSEAGAIHVEHSIFALNGKGIFLQSGAAPLLDCNLFWDNVYGHANDLVDLGETSLIADPDFCDAAGGDWRVDSGSPAIIEEGVQCYPGMGARGDCSSPGSPFGEGR